MAARASVSIAGVALVLAACTAPASTPGISGPPGSPAVASPAPWPTTPAVVPDGELAAPVAAALDRLLAAHVNGGLDHGALERIADSGDPRLAWLVADLLRMVMSAETEEALVAAAGELTGVDLPGDPRLGGVSWVALTNLLIAWDLPAPPGYREAKARIFLDVDPAWEPFFADREATLDWRLVSWGGVFIDDRAIADERPCSRGCIPALDDPALVPAADGGWYPDDGTVFGIVVDGEAVAFPKNVMEVHEMVNLTVGGRRIGLPYCTLCGSAHAFLTDAVPDGLETPVLRTSGLLSRSNKIMYDLVTRSAFNTFTGRAVTGPLREAGVVLEPITVSVSRWDAWRAARPDTRIVAEDGGIGRTYPADPLEGRDIGGPIFPVGPIDPRLPAQAQVLGILPPDGRPIAVPVDHAREALAAGRPVEIDRVRVTTDGAGLVATGPDGAEIATHQAHWFAWSQFHPATALWLPSGP